MTTIQSIRFDSCPAVSPGLKTMRGVFYCLLILWGWVFSKSAHACATSEEAKLSAIVGHPEGKISVPYAMPCDTMWVLAGDTTLIHAGSMLHFTNPPSLSSVIWVEGTLIVIGTRKHPVVFSGTLVQDDLLGPTPGEERWGGIIVRSGGVLSLKHAQILQAPTGMESASEKVDLHHTYFRGSLGFILPGAQYHSVEISGESIHLDHIGGKWKLTRIEAKPSSADKKRKSGSGRGGEKSGFWRPKPLLITLGGVALIGGGVAAVIWMNQKPAKEKADPFGPDPLFPAAP